MRYRLTAAVAAMMVVAGVLTYIARLQATPSFGFTSTTIALGRYSDIDVSNHSTPVAPNEVPGPAKPWLSFQKTKGPSDLFVQSNVWQPGGSSGWHTHPGHSLITVTAGTVTVYHGDDPTCTPHHYEAGQGFVDAGGDHVHLVRNEGALEARSITVQLIPAGAARRIDAPAPPDCGF